MGPNPTNGETPLINVDWFGLLPNRSRNGEPSLGEAGTMELQT